LEVNAKRGKKFFDVVRERLANKKEEKTRD